MTETNISAAVIMVEPTTATVHVSAASTAAPERQRDLCITHDTHAHHVLNYFTVTKICIHCISHGLKTEIDFSVLELQHGTANAAMRFPIIDSLDNDSDFYIPPNQILSIVLVPLRIRTFQSSPP